MSDRGVTEPTELIYVPQGSWAPAILAAGLAGVIAGLIVWWPYAVVGAIAALLALRGWVRSSREDFTRLPRRQRLTSATLPPLPPRRDDDGR